MAALGLPSVATAAALDFQWSELLLSPAARAATFAGHESDHPVCHRSTPELGGLQWFTGLLYHHERARRSRGSLPVACGNAQRAMGEAGSLWSLCVVCVTVHDTVASLSVRNDRNELYERIRDILMSQTFRYVHFLSAYERSAPDLRTTPP